MIWGYTYFWKHPFECHLFSPQKKPTQWKKSIRIDFVDKHIVMQKKHVVGFDRHKKALSLVLLHAEMHSLKFNNVITSMKDETTSQKEM